MEELSWYVCNAEEMKEAEVLKNNELITALMMMVSLQAPFPSLLSSRLNLGHPHSDRSSQYRPDLGHVEGEHNRKVHEVC